MNFRSNVRAIKDEILRGKHLLLNDTKHVLFFLLEVGWGTKGRPVVLGIVLAFVLSYMCFGYKNLTVRYLRWRV